MAAVVGAAFEIVRRAGGGAGELGDAGEAGEVVGESWVVESLVGDAGEAVVGVMGELGRVGWRRGAPRPLLRR